MKKMLNCIQLKDAWGPSPTSQAVVAEPEQSSTALVLAEKQLQNQARGLSENFEDSGEADLKVA